MRFVITMKRDLKMIPPVISLVRGLAELGHDVRLFSYHHSAETDRVLEHPRIQVTKVSRSPYPQGLLARIAATLTAHLRLWKFMRLAGKYDVLWIPSWDYRGQRWLSTCGGAEPLIVYHFHEHEPERFGLCRAADRVVVPEENRAWITFFTAGLARRPLVLPNTPFSHPRKPAPEASPVIAALRAAGKRVVLYQGYCSMKGRCLRELLEAVALCDSRVALCIMPSASFPEETRREMSDCIRHLSIEDKVHFIPTMEAPGHLDVVGQAHIGIGLYRPTSINQVYCAPNRLYEFTGFGIPVILPSTPPMQQLATRYPGVIVCDPSSPASIAAALESLLDDANHARASAGAQEFFEKEGSYLVALREVVSQLQA